MNEGGPTERSHEPVLVRQVLELLEPQPGMVCLDCTVGLGGHAKQIVPHLTPGGRYIGLDVDPKNLAIAGEQLVGGKAVEKVVGVGKGSVPILQSQNSGQTPRVDGVHFDPVEPISGTGSVPESKVLGERDLPIPIDLINANFTSAVSVLERLGVDGVDLLLADLGFASNQVSDPTRGFSFNVDGPLDMRLDPRLEQNAADLVNGLDEQALADVIYRYGQERLSRKIARKIVEHRQESPIKRTTDLAQLVRRVYGRAHRKSSAGRRHRIDPATRTFMALRMAVNGELTALEQLLDDLPRLLRPEATVAIISFHSLEDRPVKRAFAAWCGQKWAQKLTPKPLMAGRDEQRANRRSRSAKLRAIRWIGQQARTSLDC